MNADDSVRTLEAVRISVDSHVARLKTSMLVIIETADPKIPMPIIADNSGPRQGFFQGLDSLCSAHYEPPLLYLCNVCLSLLPILINRYKREGEETLGTWCAFASLPRMSYMSPMVT